MLSYGSGLNALRVPRLATALLFFAGVAGAQGGGRALEIEDFYRLKSVGAPQMSPDGRWVAYTVTTRVEANNADSSEVWIVTSNGSTTARRVSAPGTHATRPRWSAGRVTFAAGGRSWSVDPASPDSIAEAPETPRVTPQGDGSGAAVGIVRTLQSPNGTLTATIRDTPVQRRERTFASDFERRHEDRFRGVQFDWLDFQRDGQPFPVPNRVDPQVNPPQEIWIASRGDSTAYQLTRLSLRPTGVEWSPDGMTLMFTADMDYRDEHKYQRSDIFTASLEGRVRQLTLDGDFNYTNASYSPDGRWLLYTRQLSTNAVIAKRLDNGGRTELALMPAEGGPERILTADWDYLPSNARWSPDGKHIYFTGGIGGSIHLFRVPAAGGAAEQVTKGERRITNISFDSAFSKMAYTVGLVETPPEIYVSYVDGSGEKRLTHVHDFFVSQVALSRAERLTFRSKDGTQIEGWLLYPFGYRANAGPYPLIVSNHGGPHAADGYTFDFKSQFFAANGYFVLKVNFRGSTGYGDKFLWGTWGGWGNKDGEDVMAGVDHVLQRVRVDRRRVATIGHSYGGFMTNWLITQYPDRFAAAVAGAGIVNWVSDYGTADVARTKETEFFGTPWDDKAREIMIRQSPLTYANRVKAPTLFVHGELDERVPYSEAEQMFVALKKNGVPAKMIRYAGMAHGITGSWNMVHRMLNELRWLDAHLKRPAS